MTTMDGVTWRKQEAVKLARRETKIELARELVQERENARRGYANLRVQRDEAKTSLESTSLALHSADSAVAILERQLTELLVAVEEYMEAQIQSDRYRVQRDGCLGRLDQLHEEITQRRALTSTINLRSSPELSRDDSPQD